jgi:hypothetical protein
MATKQKKSSIKYHQTNHSYMTDTNHNTYMMHEVAQIIGFTHPLICFKHMVLHRHIIMVSSGTTHIIVLHITNNKHLTL